ncbi:MAG: hypothetical protein EDQ89_11830, partial [Acidobacteria bacterium]
MTRSTDSAPSAGPAGIGFGGLHDPSSFRDGCGVACVARLAGKAIHETIDRGLVALDRLEHRGAAGADESTGDGAGIMFELPHEFFRSRTAEIDTRPVVLPGPGRLAVAMCFLRRDSTGGTERIQRRIGELVAEAGHRVVGWRQVPVDETSCGRLARESAPRISQLFIEAGASVASAEDFDRSLFVVRRRAERECGRDVSFPSMSCRTIVYKGMLTAPQLPQFYPDLRDLSLLSRFAIVHSRFSTNTAPSWELAQPLRMIAHNGEINTLLGNVNWMRAREAVLSSGAFGRDLADCLPLIDEGVSDSAAFDRAFELMVLGGRSPEHAMMMMIPAAWEGREDVPAELEGFYRYHSRLVEPWDGPAAIAFSDGRRLGAMLDRNGLRPGRWTITRDGWVCLGSESGIFTTTPSKIARMGRLEPAQLFVVDLDTGLVSTDGEPELAVASARPYGEWYAEGKLGVRQLPDPMATIEPVEPLLKRQLAFGYTQEDLRTIHAPLLRDGREPTGSMGNDLALAVFSDQRPSLYSYFKQRFAQVTNPAIDSVREQCVMSLRTDIGPQGNLLSDEPQIVSHVELAQPILTDFELERLRRNPHNALDGTTIDITWPLDGGEDGLAAALERIRAEAVAAIEDGATLLVLSDRATSRDRVPIPSLLADRLRRDGGQPVPDAGDDDDARRADRRPRRAARRRQRARDRGDQQGLVEDPLEDRDRDDPLLPRRPDLRDRRHRPGRGRRALHRHPVAARRHRHRRARPRGARPARPRLPGGTRAGPARARRGGAARGRQRTAAAPGRRLPLASRRRAAHVGPGDDRRPAAGGPGRRRQPRVLRGVPAPGRRRERGQGAAARPPRARRARRSGPDRGGRAGGGDHAAVLDRRDEPRRAVAGGARDARDRDEPARRPLQQRRGRRGPPPQHARPERRR